mgnify:CR=1 FL=1|tara:strand:+ start:2042 stop:6697 length:4656 start_codon:yes stop_codon:yes gene_type:complete
MKKITLLLASLLFAVSSVYSQNINKLAVSGNGSFTVTLTEVIPPDHTAKFYAGQTTFSDGFATFTLNTPGVMDVVINGASGEYYVAVGYKIFKDIDNTEHSANEVQVRVGDITKPVITLTGAATQTIQPGGSLTLGATSTDIIGGHTDTLTVTEDLNGLDINTPGTYTILYNVSDLSGNSADQVTRTIVVEDITAPVITLTGNTTETLEVGSTYTDAGATANDDTDGDISNNITEISTVDVNTVGSYTVTYNVSDAAGNPATAVVRTVEIVDTTKPIITLTGNNPQIIEVHSAYTELNATANDNYDGNISGNIIIDATNVNTAIVGSYSVTYNVVDANTNSAIEVIRTVNVVDTTKPIITLTGNNPQIIEYNELYSELGATATDNYDDDTALTSTIIMDASNVVVGLLGTYTVTYNVTDTNGNVADQVERTVNIVDTTKPILTLTGVNPQLIEIINGDDAVYVELGATASDEYDVNVDDADIIIDTTALVLDTVGCYPVTYTVTDASGNTRVRTRIVFVLEEAKPWAKDNSFTVNQDSSNNIFNVLGNDSYGTDGANGTHPISLSGTYTDNGGKLDLVGTNVQYTPRAGFSGVDYFSYTITDENGDGSGDASTANVTISVVLNPAPTAVDDAIIVAENSGITSIDVLVNDNFGTDGPHGSEALTISGMSVEGGTITVNAGQIDYTPLANFTGLDSFTYTIKDSGGDEATATVLVTVTIDGTNLPITRPTALPDAVTVSQNSSNNVLNVLANNGFGADNFGTEGPIDGGLTMTNGTNLGASDQGGVISIDNKATLSTLDDAILYTPKAGFIGEDSFKYMITDAVGDTSITIVTVTVEEINTPTAVNDAVIVMQDSGLTNINVLTNDSFGSDGAAIANSLSLPLAVSTEGGAIAVNAGEVEYTPASGFNGQDTFTYSIEDGSGDISTATVTVTVSLAGSSNTPTANDDAVSVIQDSADNGINILLDNGSGIDDFGSDGPSATHPISLSATFTDNGGKLILNGSTVEYTPRTGFTGIDYFSYTLTDTTGDASIAQVTINVSAVATPTAVADIATVAENSGATTINVLANDSFGLDGQAIVSPLTLPLALSTEGGTIVVNAGAIDYTPAANFDGIDTFSYTIEDGNGDTSNAIVTVTVEDQVVINRRPHALPDAVTVSQNSSNNSIDVLADNGAGADDFGTEGAIDNGLTMTNGTLTGDSDQGGSINVDNKGTADTLDDVILYTPKGGFIGEDSFKYTITDATGFTSISIVTVTVEEINTPTAVDDSIVVIQNSGIINIDVLENDSFGSDGAHSSESLALVSLTGTSNQGGTIAINAGEIEYTPALNYNGVDTFEYTIKDATDDESTATVNITVTLINSGNKPNAKDDAVTVVRNSIDNIINILDDNGSGTDDFGTDGPNATHPISLSGTYTDIGSKIELDGNTVKFTPKTNFTGTDTFGYTITDANGDASTAIVTVNIAALKSSTEIVDSIESVFQVYPNPSKGDLNVSVFSKSGEQVSIFLFDVTGKIVYKSQRELSTGNNIIDLNLRVKAGVMFLKVYSENNNYGTKKVIFK